MQLSALLTGMGSPFNDDDDELFALRLDEDEVDQNVEIMYLTLSWWLLNVGWKDIGERVRRGVEEVFDEYVLISLICPSETYFIASSVSLKTKLDAMDLHRLIGDVRRRVEYEVTFERTQRRTS